MSTNWQAEALRYYPRSSFGPKWACCGEDRDFEGCRKRKYLDKRVPGVYEKIERRKEAASADAIKKPFEVCIQCDANFRIWEVYPDSDSHAVAKAADKDM